MYIIVQCIIVLTKLNGSTSHILTGLLRFYIMYFGDWDIGNRLIRPLTDYVKPFIVGSIQYKNLTNFEDFGKTLRVKYKNDWTYPVSRFLQPEDLVPDNSGSIPLVKAVVDAFDLNVWMCVASINGGKW